MKEEIIQPDFKLPPPRAFIQKVDNLGEIKVKFTRLINPPSYSRFEEFNDPDRMSKPSDSSKEEIQSDSPSTSARRLQVSRANRLSYSDAKQEAIDIINYGNVAYNDEKKPIIDLKVVPGPESI